MFQDSMISADSMKTVSRSRWTESEREKKKQVTLITQYSRRVLCMCLLRD